MEYSMDSPATQQIDSNSDFNLSTTSHHTILYQSRHSSPQEQNSIEILEERRSPLLTIQGPLTPQCLDIHSSSGSSMIGHSTSSSHRIRRTVSTSDIPQYSHPFFPNSITVQSSPARVSVALSSAGFSSNLPPSESAMDWIAYSADHHSDAALEAELAWADSENNWSESDWDCDRDVVGPAVLKGDNDVSGHLKRPVIDPEMLASLLRDCLLHPPLSTRSNLKDAISDEDTSPVTPPSRSVPQEFELKVDNLLPEEFFHPLWLPHKTRPIKVRIPNDYSSSQHGGCDACGGLGVSKVIRLIPCGHIICSLCFSTSLSAVSVVHGSSKCTACMEEVSSFQPFDNIHQAAQDKPCFDTRQSQRRASRSAATNDGNVVMRIDNVAWDITPAIVKAFLPRDSLASSPVPIHILLDRFDGRTKDYLYIEVISQEAARKIMKTRQNTFMAGGALTGGRKRPVTISPVSHTELISELRPRSAVELNGLLSLCQAAVSTPPITNPALSDMTSFVAPNGVAHFVKSRHGPFYALMSILSKLRGKQSPAYWDVFHVASGAIAALANSISRYSTKALHTSVTDDPTDEEILERLTDLFQSTFQLRPDRAL